MHIRSTCVIPKLFPFGGFLSCMKLTKTKLLETIRRKNEGCTTYQARKIARVTVRRVNQVWAYYLVTGKVPDIGQKAGRPLRPILQEEEFMVKEAFATYNVSASTLELIIERDFGRHLPHNHIHKIMVKLGLAKQKAWKDIRKKDWIRYERRHSLTAVHIDWYYDGQEQVWVFAVLDDASRKLLALVECGSPTVEASIEGMEAALQQGRIKQCISDHGTQFIKQEGMNSQFSEFLKRKGIKQILCRIKHPQANGKVEKFFDLYQNKRHCFKTKEEFMHWYNEVRPHRSLQFKTLETPAQAFTRKMRAEA